MDVPKTVKSWAAVSWALVWAPWCMGRSAGPAVQTYAAGLSAQQRSTCWWCHLSFLSKAAVIVRFLGQDWIEMGSSTTSEGLTCPPVRRMLQAANSGISVQLPKLWAPLWALCFGSGHAFLEVQRCYVQSCYPYSFCGCSPKCGLGVGFVSLFFPYKVVYPGMVISSGPTEKETLISWRKPRWIGQFVLALGQEFGVLAAGWVPEPG